MADIQGTVNGETLDGTSDSDIINAGDGNDIVNGLGGDDTLNGEGGNDTLDGGQGNDLLVGGAGDDIYIINDADGIIENAGEGTDEIRTSIDWGLIDHVENITATGSGNVFLGGNSGANVITGNSGDNYIVGEGDNDTIDGGAGRDVASFQLPEGLAGTVRQVAGAGAEEGMILIQLVNGEDVQTWARVSVSAVGSATVEGVGIGAFLGTDTVSNVEELHFFVANTPDFANQFTNVQLATIHSGQFVSGGEAGDTIDLAAYPGATDANGNGGNDTIIGTAGVNYLMGGAGNDSIDGGAGADVAAFHLGQDSTGTITQVAGTGEDQGKILIQVVNGELSETFAKVTVTAQGSAVVEGVGIGAFLGIDTITNIEQLHFTVGNGSEGQFTSVSLAPQQFGDFVAGGEAGETIDLAAFPGALNANGNGGDDTVLGTADANTLSGGNGNDVVSGGDGHDILRGNGGDDVLHGEDGNDILIGGAGNDLLIGGNGIDRISLYNEVHGLTVDLRLDGIAQDFGVMGIDTLSGIEHVYATYWSDNLFGNEAGNWFFAAAGNDTIATFGGDDYVTLGYGDKIVDGGDGNDTVEIIDDAFEPLYTAEGITVSLLLQGQAQATGVGNWTLTGIENLSGDWGSDDFTGDGNANILAGAGGDDTLSGGGGNDILMGDGAMVLGFPFDQNVYQFVADIFSIGFGITEGHDTLRGGAGDDMLYGAGGDDLLVGGIGNDLLDGGAGIDRVSLFDDGTGGFGIVVDLRLDGIAQDFGPLGFDTLIGIEHVNTTYNDDTVHGNEAANWIWTYMGLDTLYGYGGDDLFTVGQGTKIIDGGEGSDTVEIDDQAWEPLYGAGGITVSLALQGSAQATGVGDWTLTGIENLSGNWGDDHFTGDENANILAGFGGHDTLIGGGGDDILMGDGAITTGEVEGSPGSMVFLHDLVSAGFTITEGDDFLSGGAGFDKLYGGGGNDILDGGDDDDALEGGAGDDTLHGGGGHDVLRGQAGNDILNGDAGDDFLVGGAGNDVIDGGDGIDRVSLFDPTGSFGITVDLRLEGVAQDFGALGVDTLSGIEHVTTTYGSDTVDGNDAANWIWSFAGLDTLSGHGGDDLFTVGYGDKIIDGGSGSDTVEIDDTDAYEPQYGAGGITVSLELQGQAQATGVGNWTLTNVENLSGNFGDDEFTGDANANILAGFGGNDILIGGGGDDVLMGDGAITIGEVEGSPGAMVFLHDLVSAGFTITEGADTLSGGAGNDTLYGGGGNDSLDGGADNDTLHGGTGTDTLLGGDGDDTLILAELTAPGEVYNGGLGFDTLELRSAGAAISYGMTNTTVTGLERLVYASQAGTSVTANFLLNQINGGLTQVVGGEGRDVLTIIAGGPGGTFTMPTLGLSNWSPSTDPDVPGDLVVLFAAGNGSFTLNAREGLAANQVLIGAALNDTLNGSSGTDLLNGQGGVNVLNGFGGDDVLTIANTVNQQGFTTYFTGLGSSFNGGDGTDTLSVGGVVYFEGTLSSIEGIYLQPAITTTAPLGAGSQEAAYFEMALGGFAALGASFYVDGTGTIDPDLSQGDSFDFSGVVFNPGSNVTFVFDGESEGLGTEVTWVGTSNGDIFEFGSDLVTVTGGGGVDIYEIETDDSSSVNATILDFTPGEDKIDLTDTGITGEQRLRDFVSQVGNDVLISAASGGQSIQVLLKDTLLEDLSEDDFILADWDGPENETGTVFDDILFGFAGNDELRGGDGNDRIYSGGGTDLLFGDAGDDTLIIDELFTGGTFDGGAGTDTLELRTAAYNQNNAAGPATSYAFFQSTLSGIEKVRFASDEDAGVNASMVFNQVIGAGIGELIGGVGIDTLTLIAAGPSGTAFTMPNFVLTDWQSSATPFNSAGDALMLVVGVAGNFTLNAREGLASTQVLIGGAGNDTLNGSSGTDVLAGGAGANVLYGNDGDDVLLVVNAINAQGQLTAYTGGGSSFNGGSGHDTLSIGGVVEFEGTLSGIERIHLQAEFVSSAPNGQGTQAAAVLFLAGNILGSLPADLVLSGTGTLAVDLDPGDSYDASGWTIGGGSAVAVHVTGSSNADRIVLGSFAETVEDDGGIDTAVFAGNSAGYVIANGAGDSLIVGNDTLTGIELLEFDDGTFFWNGSALVSAVSEGLVADGYVAGAIVYIDGNNNGTLDADEAYTITDANGDFTLISPSTGPLRAFGGTNLDTGLPNTVQMSAPDGASVINPLTTLVQVMVANGQAADATAAAAAVSSALGLTVDVLNTDVFGAALAGDPAALEAQKAAATVVSIINTATDAGGTQAGTGALVSLGSLIQAAPAEPISLADASVITQVLENNVSAEQLNTAVGSVTVNAEKIQQATTLNEVSAAQAEAATTGNDLANTLYGGAQADTLRGFGGNDVLDGRGGADTMFGGTGDDVYFIDDAGDLVLESSGAGYDTVFTLISAVLGDDVERLVATLPASTTPLSLTGNAVDNEISGNAGANVLDGRAGADLMMGLGGNDVYLVDNAGDVVLESADAGYDTIFTSIDYTLGANLERLVTTDPSQTTPLRLTGNALSNEITGNAGANWLDGGAGADLMVGGDGDDIYFVDHAGDVVSDGPDAGYDTVFTSVSFVLDTLLERVVAFDLNSTEALSFTGNEKSNEISGNAGGNLIDGKGGSDILFGGEGADGFAFTTALGEDNIDAMPLYEVGVDRMYLDDAIFTGLTEGVLSANAFHVGSAAADADDRIIYDSNTGALYYDADGNGAGLAIQFAQLHEALPLVSTDFQVI